MARQATQPILKNWRSYSHIIAAVLQSIDKEGSNFARTQEGRTGLYCTKHKKMMEEKKTPPSDDPLPSTPTHTPRLLYYYQNPTSGAVSNNPLSIAQLIRLLVPVRDGLVPILASHTQCLAYNPEKAETEGAWSPASSIDVLREASCNQWHVSLGDGTTKGPISCRSLFDILYSQAPEKPKVLAFAPNVTTEWTEVEKMPSLQYVFEVLEQQKAGPPQMSVEDVPANNTVESSSSDTKIEASSQTVQDELEAFLSSTAQLGGKSNGNDDDDDDDDDQAYESDGGTKYVKEPLSGRWIHEALAPPREEKPATVKEKAPAAGATGFKFAGSHKKKSKKKDTFNKRNARNWVYITGLPTNAKVSDIQKFFGKVGLLDLDPETLQPKIKLYRNKNGKLKGDASLCYARPESVELALQVLDESPWDQEHTIRVERAKFEAKESASGQKRERKNVSQAQRKVARLALLQAQDEGFGERLAGGRKGLRIVVVKHMLDGVPESDWETKIQDYCKELDAEIEKITCISKNKVVIAKFFEPPVASAAVEAWNGKLNPVTRKPMVALYWDGVTDYTMSHESHNPEEEERRHEDFGKWLDDQGEVDLPPELRLQVAED